MKTETKIKFIKKPTPLRNAVLVCSLTTNVFLGLAAYAVYNGQLARTDVSVVQPVELHAANEEDYVTQLASKRR